MWNLHTTVPHPPQFATSVCQSVQDSAQLLRGDVHGVAAVVTEGAARPIPPTRFPDSVTMAPEASMIRSENARLPGLPIGVTTAATVVLLRLVLARLLAATVAAGLPARALFAS